MHFQLLALALAVAAHAAPQGSESVEDIASILATALPSSLMALASTDEPAFRSVLSSEFASSQVPAWFSALPSDVQTYIKPAVTTPASASSDSTTAVVGTAPIGSITAASTGFPSGNGTAIQSSGSSGSTLGGASNTSTTGSASSSSSSGGASIPTAVLGLGFAGLAGMIGVLAL